MERDLLHKYFKGEATLQEEQVIMDWAEASPENWQEYLQERKIWNALQLLPACLNFELQQAHRFRLVPFMKYAAAILLLIAAGTTFLIVKKEKSQSDIMAVTEPTLWVGGRSPIGLQQQSFEMEHEKTVISNNMQKGELSYASQEDSLQTLQTEINLLLVPQGKTWRLILSDSTIVMLNSSTELSFPSTFGPNTREVRLKGEAFFQVAHNERKPFIVHTDDMNIRVLGTTFNISSYADEQVSTTTLVQGSVCIEQEGNTQLLRPSEQYVYNRTSQEKTVREVDIDMYIAWTNGEYIFRNTTLHEILSKIARWYPFQVSYANPMLESKRFSFTIGRDASLEQIIWFINSTKEVYIERTNNYIHVKEKP